MTANPNNTWAQLKEQLAVRLSDVTDAQMALSLLRRVRQKQGETYNSELLGENSVSGRRSLMIIKGVMRSKDSSSISLLMRLVNDQLKMKILRDQPNTLQGAVALATNEQNLRARVQMSHQGSKVATSYGS